MRRFSDGAGAARRPLDDVLTHWRARLLRARGNLHAAAREVDGVRGKFPPRRSGCARSRAWAPIPRAIASIAFGEAGDRRRNVVRVLAGSMRSTAPPTTPT